MPNIEQFYDRVETSTYKCLEFVCEVWPELTGESLQARLPSLRGSISSRRASVEDARHFERLEAPKSPCLAFFQDPGKDPHVGIYWEGAVLHLTPHGVEYQPLRVAKRSHKKVSFYR